MVAHARRRRFAIACPHRVHDRLVLLREVPPRVLIGRLLAQARLRLYDTTAKDPEDGGAGSSRPLEIQES